MADLNVKVGLDRSGFQTGLAAMENDAAKFGQTISNIRPGNVAGAFKNIANDLASARSPAEALSAVMGNLTNLLRGTAFGAAGLAIGKVLSAPFEQLSGLVQSSAASVRQALDSIASAGPAMSFDEAVAQANALDSAIAQIQNSIQQIDTNPFLRLADSFVGARLQLDELGESLRRVKASQLSEGAFNEANLSESLVGKDADEKARIRIKADAEKERQKIRDEFQQTGLNADTAIADVDRKEAAQLADLDLKKEDSKSKETERDKKERLSAEEKYRNAVRERETKSLDATEQIGRAEAELMALQSQAAGLADNAADKFELLAEIEKKRGELMDLNNRRQEDAVRLAEEEARAKQQVADSLKNLESLEAEMKGPEAELELQRRRTREAGDKARETGRVQDVEEARREAVRLAGMETSFRRDDFSDPKNAEQFGRDRAAAVVGELPTAKEFGSFKPDPVVQQQIQGVLGQIQEAIGPSNMRDIANLQTMEKPQDGPKEATVQRIYEKLDDAVIRLEQLIRASGTFGI